MQEHIAEDGALEQHRSQLKASSLRKKNGQKPQNCKVEMTRCTINLKNLCIFALRGTYFPSKFQGSAVSLVVKGSHTDLHRFDPRRPYSIKTRIKTISPKIELTLLIFLADHIPLKQGFISVRGRASDPSGLSRRPQHRSYPHRATLLWVADGAMCIRCDPQGVEVKTLICHL